MKIIAIIPASEATEAILDHLGIPGPSSELETWIGRSDENGVGFDCVGWTSSRSEDQGQHGDGQTTDWFDGAFGPCSNVSRLFCIEQ